VRVGQNAQRQYGVKRPLWAFYPAVMEHSSQQLIFKIN